MASISDNIANANTTGYKASDVQFSTLVAVSGSPKGYSAGGVVAVPTARISQQGLLQASASSTDMGIDGAGFFVVRTGAEKTDETLFSRAGSFKPDAQGFYRNTSGLYLQGWRLDQSGGFTNTGSLSALGPIRLSDMAGTAEATTRVQMRANLSATVPATPGYAAGDIAAGRQAPAFSRSIDVFDAQGGEHRLTLGFVKTAANQWAAEVFSEPASAVSAPGGVLASGTVSFNPDGTLDRAGSSAALFAPIAAGWTNGSAAGSITFDLGMQGRSDGLTQFGSPSALISSSVDGGLLGNVASVQISREGAVSAVFEDGTTRKLYQLPIATFANPDGLVREQGNAYRPSNESGAVAINAAGRGGAGLIAAGSLEASNVDLAGEFAEMIKTQRAYSASSKIITTVDEMLQEASNLKR
jgi:flagellar hook protein FlgE